MHALAAARVRKTTSITQLDAANLHDHDNRTRYVKRAPALPVIPPAKSIRP
jgi:hypothetical protein